MDNLSLLILDLQDTFLRVIPQSEELLKRCSFAIEAACLLGIKLIYTEQFPEKLGGTHHSLINAGLRHLFSKKNLFGFWNFSFTR